MIEAVSRYIDQRNSLGYKDVDLRRDLLSFAHYSVDQAAAHLRQDHALAWVELKRDRSDRSRRRLLASIRRLGLFLQAEDPRHEILSEEYTRPRCRYPRPIPYIFTDAELRGIIHALAGLRRSHPYDPLTYKHLVGLIAVTGVRVGEARSLRRSDLNGTEMLVRMGKFGKDRIVHIDPTTVNALQLYLQQRPYEWDSDKLFVVSGNKPPSKSAISATFRACTNKLNLFSRNGSGLPRVHDLRHSFASRALALCGSNREAVSNQIISLSAYLGHVSLASTYWYLEISTETKETMAQAMEAVFHV